MITGIIFDLDGLLADTERLHCMAYQEALHAHGAAVSDHEYAEHWVRSGRGITEWISERGLTLDPIALRAHKSRCYLDLLRSELRPMEGALALLEQLYSRKKLALASSSYPDAVEGVLAGLGIAHYFQVIVTGLDVAQVKPAPDIFLAAAQRLGAAPSQCLVLEDAEKGVIAASLAGIRCIAIPNHHTRHHDFSKATRVCSSLKEITLELLDALEWFAGCMRGHYPDGDLWSIALERWSHEIVTLLGDAAHPMTPDLDQGACQALEDAPSWPAAEKASDPVSALRNYESRRIRRANSFVRASRIFGRIFQLKGDLACRARDRVLESALYHRLQLNALRRLAEFAP